MAPNSGGQLYFMSTKITVPMKDSWAHHRDSIASLVADLNSGLRETFTDATKNSEAYVNDLASASDQLVEVNLLMSILNDLAWHDWKFELHADHIEFTRPESDAAEDNDKSSVRSLHERDRDIQLMEPSVVEFLSGLEKPRLSDNGRHSIFSLMRPGQELADQLKSVRGIIEQKERLHTLRSVVNPYIQIVESGQRCQFTGLKLQDIWRYFRHTWSTTYKSLPGRTVNILVRDAAAPNHPIIGIAALGSSIIQQSTRDKWIGWDIDSLINGWQQSAKPQNVRILLDLLQEQIESIFVQDFKNQRVLSELDLKYPRTKVIERLNELADREKSRHHDAPQRVTGESQKSDWFAECQTPLYCSKRATALAGLLTIRQTFLEYNLEGLRGKQLLQAVSSSAVSKAIGRLLKTVKSVNVGIHMMDIVVCGAVEPYRAILGGKLVCMLLASPEISQYYNNRYSSQVSIIASSMKGEAVIRKPQLSLLCTTSLYGSGSSQYNRISMPLSIFRKSNDGKLKYERLGKSEGFGTFHFSSHTNKLFDAYLGQVHGQKLVNNIFGEGVNPLMRKIRQGLGSLGIDAHEVLRHKSNRILYGVALANNFQQVLMGRGVSAQYKIPQSNPIKTTRKIVSLWMERWLDQRIKNDSVIDTISTNQLVHPIDHGARPKYYNLNQNEQHRRAQ